MASICNRILDAVETALDGGGKPTGTTVHSDPTEPFEGSASLKEIVLDPVTERVEPDDFAGMTSGQNVERTLTLRIWLRAQGTPPRNVVDPLRVWVAQTMAANRTWGGLAIDTREVSTDWAADRAEAVYASAVMTYTIEYTTTGADPESQ